jgi:hypothetical protein
MKIPKQKRSANHWRLGYVLPTLILITASRSLIAAEGSASTTMQVIVPSQVVASAAPAIPPTNSTRRWTIPFSAQGRTPEREEQLKVSVEISRGETEIVQLSCQQKEQEVVCNDSPAWSVASMAGDKKSELQATMVFSDL